MIGRAGLMLERPEARGRATTTTLDVGTTPFKRPTINDVAAMSETGTVSASTRARVLDAVATLGYRPNATARNLLLRRTNLIGVVVGDVANAFDAGLVKGIERHAAASGFTTLVCNTGGDPRLEALRIEALLEQRVDGIAVLDFTGDRTVLSQLLAERVPVVMVSCWSEYADSVAVDDMVGIDLAVRHLVELGHERIAYVVDPLMEATTRQARVQSFERALLRSGLSPRRAWTVAYDPDDAEPEIVQVARADEGPTAVVAANDYTAIRLLELLERNGLAVPGDISLVGFDGIDIAGLARLGLTTVVQPRDILARTGVELLEARMASGYHAPPQQHRLTPSLTIRTSTALPR